MLTEYLIFGARAFVITDTDARFTAFFWGVVIRFADKGTEARRTSNVPAPSQAANKQHEDCV